MRIRSSYWSVVLLLLLGFSTAYSQTSITPASLLVLCNGGSVQTLSTITVSETANNGFNTQSFATFILAAPGNFIFVTPGAVSVGTSSGNITVNSVSVSTSAVTLNLSVSAAAATDFFTISNLQVQGVGGASSGNITRLNGMTAGGSFNVSGGTAARGTGATYAPLSSNTAPTTANAGPDQTLCTTTSFNMAANTPTSGTGTWSLLSGTASITTPGLATTTVTGVTSAATLRWTISNAPCPDSFDDVVVTNLAGAAAADAGIDQSQCNSGVFVLAGSDPSPGSGLWTVTGGTATISSPSSMNSAVTGVPAGTSATLKWTVTNAPCSPMNASVTLTNLAPPTTANAGPDLDQCATSAFTMAGNVPASGTGAWSVVSGTATITTAGSATTTVTGVSATATLRWTISNGSCTPTTDDVVILNRNAAVTANAGTNQSQCNNGTFILSGSDPSPGTGLWTVTGGTATISSPSSMNSGVTGVPAGTTATLTWTITNGSCSPANASVTLTNLAPPTTANAGPDLDQCATSSFTMAGNVPASGTGAWSVVSGTATITTAGSATTTVTGVSGTAILRWTISNGSCIPTTDDVVILNRNAAVTANAGTNQSQCNNGTFVLSGSDPSPGTGLWTVTGGTATISSPSSMNSGVTGVPAGTTATLTWTITNGSCSPANASVTLTNLAPPTTANAGPDLDQCATSAFTMAGNVPVSGTGAWSVVSGTATITTAGSATTTVTGVSGTATLRWTIGNGSCTPSTDDVVILNRNAAVTANAGTNQSQCNNGTFVLSGSDPSPGTGLWTVTGGTATISSPSSMNSSVTGVPAGTTATLTWTITNGSCSPANASVTLTNLAPPTTANAGPDLDQCATSAFTMAGNVPASGTGAWSVVSGTATITTAGSATTTVTGVSGTATLRWTISNGSCTPTTDDVILLNRSAAVTANAGTNQSQCNNGTFVLSGSDPSPGTGLWTVTGGTATISSPSSMNSGVTGVPAGTTATLTWTVTNGSCSPANAGVTLTNLAPPTTANAGPDLDQCATSAFTMAGNVPASGTGAWSVVSGTATITTAGSATTTVTGVSGTATLRWTISNGSCTPTTDDVILLNRSAAVTANAGTNQSQCNNGTFVLSGSDPSPGTGLWTVTGGTATISSPSSMNSGVTGVPAGTTATLTWTITNGSCSPANASVTLTNLAPPTTANAGPDLDQCATSAFTMAGNVPASGTGAWSVVSGTATITTAGSATTTVTGVSGIAILRWTISNGSCTPTTDDVILLNRSAAVTANAGTNQSQCNNGTFVLSGSDPSPGTGLWTVTGGTATISSPSSMNSGVTGVPAGTTATLTWTVTNGSCGSASTTVSLTNFAPATTSNAGPDQNICGSSALLAANAAGTWSIISGAGGSFVSSTNPNTTFNGLPNTTYGLRWTTTNGLCSSADDVQINLKPIPDAAAAGQIICSGQTTSITITNPNAVTGTTFAWTISAPLNISGASGGSGALISQALTSADGTNSGSVTYVITPTSNGCAGTPVSAIVNVNPVPTTSATPISSSICGGTATNIALSNPNNVAGGVTYNWTVTVLNGTVSGQSAGSGNVIAQTLTTDNAGANVRYRIQATSVSGTCTGPPVNVDVAVKPVPDALVAAGSTTQLCSGTSTSITLQNPNGTSGTTFTWTAIVTSGAVTGYATGSGSVISQTLSTTSSGGTVQYTIIPSAGGCAGTPITTSVTVNPVPVSNNISEPAVCSDVAFSFDPQSAITNGVVSTFTWTASYPPLLTGGAASGNNNITGTLTNATGGVLNAVYTITPTAGSCTGATYTMSVPVNPKPVGVVMTELPVCSDASFSFVPPISNGVTSIFAWTASYATGLTGGVASGSGNLTGTLTNVSSAPLNATFIVTPTSTSPASCAGAPFQVTIPVQPKPKGADATAPAICSSSSVAYNLQTNVNGVNGIPSNFTWLATSYAGISGASTSSVSGPVINDILTNVSGSDKVATYVVTPTGTNGCAGNTFQIMVTVHSAPVGTNLTKTAVCSGTPFSYDPQLNISNGMTSTFTWTASYPAGISGGMGNGTGAVVETLANFSATTLNAVYTVIPVSGGCAGNTFTITAPVSPAPVGLAQNLTRCSNVAVGVAIGTTSGSIAAANYTIAVSAPTGVTLTGGTPSAGTGKASTEIQADTWANLTGLPITVIYSITPVSATGCAGTSFNILVIVNPEPVGAAQTVMRCSDQSVSYDLINNVALQGNNVGSTFSWKAISFAGVTGASASPVVGPIITDILVNVTGTDKSVVYLVTPTALSGCTGATFNITVTVHSKPVGVTKTLADICSGTNVNYDLGANVIASNNVTSSFIWTAAPNGNVTGESSSAQTTSVISDVLVNTTFTQQTVVYTATPTGTTFGCTGNPFTITVGVAPKPVISAGPDLSVCADLGSKILQGTVAFAPGGVSWSGGAGSFANQTTTTPTYTYKKPGEVGANIVLTITTPSVGPCAAQSDQMILHVYPLPNPSFAGLPLTIAENDAPVNLTANKSHGLFTITPGSGLSSTTTGADSLDHVTMNPAAAMLGQNYVTYSYTDNHTCHKDTTRGIFVNAVTNVSFTVDKQFVNSSGETEVCADQGLIHITPKPPISSGQPVVTRMEETSHNGQPLNGSILPGPTGGEYYLNTNGVPSGFYDITYFFTNSSGANSQYIATIKILASPVAKIFVANSCVQNAILFTDQSAMHSSGDPNDHPAITDWTWDFADGNNSIQQNPSHKYSSQGKYNVKLTVTTTQACKNTSTLAIRVGDFPLPDFSFGSICRTDYTKFRDTTQLKLSRIVSYDWDFGDGIKISGDSTTAITGNATTVGTYKDPQHNYTTYGTYKVIMGVHTNDSCFNSTFRKVFILPDLPLKIDTADYFENFEKNDGGWKFESLDTIALNPADTSWHRTMPNGTVINKASSGSYAWWTNGNNDPTIYNATNTKYYYPSESSAVNGPCFDLSALKRPMISFDYWDDTQSGFDGVGIQFSTDGGLIWKAVGANDEGINWYNTVNIVGRPGKVDPFGWSGSTGKWVNGRANLNNIPIDKRSRVRIRLALGSDANNLKPSDGNYLNGFAFDNVFVGEKKRHVLVEHFTNSGVKASSDGDTYLNGLYAAENQNGFFSDFEDIQYHVINGQTSASPDKLATDNLVDPSTRLAFYQGNSAGTTIMDGILDNIRFTGATTEINATTTDQRALVSSPFKLKLDTASDFNANTISADLTITPADTATILPFTSSLIVQVVLVENSITIGGKTFQNVVRKQLYGPAGIGVDPIGKTHAPVKVSLAKILVNVPIGNPANLSLIAYVQNRNTREIYQSLKIGGPKVPGQLATGIGDPAIHELDIQIFPNPATTQISVLVPDDFPSDYVWTIIDQRGIAVRTGDFSGMINSRKQISVDGLASGMYFVNIGAAGKEGIHRKLVILR